MVSNNRRLKFVTSLNEEDSPAWVALRTTRYRSHIKYISSVVQHQISH